MRHPIASLSFLGIVTLTAIIINDSVVLVDKYNKPILINYFTITNK